MTARIARTMIALSCLCSWGCTGTTSGGSPGTGGAPDDGGGVSGTGGATTGASGGSTGADGGPRDGGPLPPQGSGGAAAEVGSDSSAGDAPVVSTTMALNIRLQKVEITQAVSIPLGPDPAGAAVAVAARNGKVIEKRPALIRAHVAVGAGWVPRTIEAVLYLKAAGGASPPLPLTKMVAASSVAATLDSTFNWTLSDVQVEAGLTAHVELHEAAGATGSGGVLDSPRFPAQGDAELGIQAGAMQVNAVLVPITVGGTTVTVGPTDLQAWGDYLQGVYPIQKSFITVHPVVAPSWTTFGDDQENLGFDLCAQLKATDKAEPNIYHVLLIPGTKATVGWDGTSSVASDKPSDASDRCSMVVTDRTNTLPPKSLVFAHELGHAHGLQHAPCGSADGPDPRYPYAKAAIGVQGYNILKKVLYDPVKVSDLMSYCEPAWISDYFWNKLETRVRIQTTWGVHHQTEDQVADGAATESRAVRGLFRAGGAITWAVILGSVSEPTAASAAPDSHVRAVDGKQAGSALPFLLQKMAASHGLYEFKFTLPAGNDATAFDVSVAGIEQRLTLAEIRDLSR